MPRDGSIIPADLVGKLEWLVVSCEKCGRLGRYNVARLVKQLVSDSDRLHMPIRPSWLKFLHYEINTGSVN